MRAFDALHFVRPWWFVAFVLLAALLWLLAHGRFSGKRWEAICDRHLLSFMLLGRTIDVSRRSFLYLAGFAGALAITALAGPAWERLPQPVLRDNSALVIVFDLSLSMDAIDIKPNRLSRARFKIRDLIDQRNHGQTGLVVYARDAFTVVPLTDDTAAIELYLGVLNTELMPRQGSRADLGLQEAGVLLQKIDAAVGDVLLVSDYVDTRAQTKARQLNLRGHTVSVLGIGTESGGPVSLHSGEFLSHKGEVVIPRFSEADLDKVAQAGGGIYVRFNPFGSDDVETFVSWFGSRLSAIERKRESEISADLWREQGPWLILMMLPVVALGFRRGLLVVSMCAVLVQSEPAYAADWANLWLRPDQQAVRALEKGDAARAAELFESSEWRAAAQFRNGDFAGATETLEALDSTASWYNKGNALAHSGKLKEAIEAYRHALGITPDMEDAQFNMNLVKQVLKQMKTQQMQASGQGEESDGDEGQQAQQAQAQRGDEGGDKQQQAEPSKDRSDQGDEQELAEEDTSEDGEGADGKDNSDSASPPVQTMAEDDQAVEQWLRGVPDNPGRLLKRKLLHLSRNKKSPGKAEDKPW